MDAKLHASTLREAAAALAAGSTSPPGRPKGEYRSAQREDTPLTARALADAQLARIAATDAAIEAWETLDPAHVRSEAQRCDDARAHGIAGPLAGIGIAVKDIIATADLPTTMGSKIYAGHRPAADATCVARLRSGGAYVFGKVVTTPFAYMDPGKTRNPWDPAHSPGGSSSGSAAAVAAAHVCAAIGTQTNGSIIRPAAYCGVVGFKPTFAAIPVAGVYPFSTTFDTVGTFTRTVADAALLASVLADAGRIAPAIAPWVKAPRFAYIREFPWVRQDDDAQSIVDAAVARLATVAEVVPVAIAAPWREANRILRTIMLFEAAHQLGDLQQRERARLSPAVNSALDEGGAIGENRYREALDARTRAIAFFTDWLGGFDVVLAPATPGPAPKGLATTGDPSCCTLWSLLGFPALSLPAGLHGRLPMGLQLAAPQGSDDRLLSMAAWCEARLPFRALD